MATATSGQAGHAPAELRGLAADAKVLSEPTRLRVLARLVAGPVGVADLCRELGIVPQLASHHIAILRRSGVIIPVRVGRENHHVVDSEWAESFRSRLGALFSA